MGKSTPLNHLLGVRLQTKHELRHMETMNLLWALAWASADRKDMFHDTLKFFAERLLASGMAEYRARTVSTFIWAFAHLNYHNEKFLEVIEVAGRHN